MDLFQPAQHLPAAAGFFSPTARRWWTWSQLPPIALDSDSSSRCALGTDRNSAFVVLSGRQAEECWMRRGKYLSADEIRDLEQKADKAIIERDMIEMQRLYVLVRNTPLAQRLLAAMGIKENPSRK